MPKDEKKKRPNPEDEPSSQMHFSQSQIGLKAKCDQAFAFRYGEHKKKPPTGAMTFGNCFERAINASLENRLETGDNLPTKDVAEIAVAEIEDEKDETVWLPDDPFAKAKDQLPPLVGVYHDGFVPEIAPVAVQKEVKFDFALDGETATWVSYIDVEEEDGTLRDIKTTKRKWTSGKELQEIQPVTYTMHRPGDGPMFRFDIGIRGKKPSVDVRNVLVTAVEKKAFGAAFIALAESALELKRDPERARPTARFMPGAWWCSKKWCGFWQECQARWNLPIKD